MEGETGGLKRTPYEKVGDPGAGNFFVVQVFFLPLKGNKTSNQFLKLSEAVLLSR